MVNQSETSVAASNGEAANLRQNYLSMAERWKKDVKEFILDAQDDDSSKYPLFSSTDTFNNKGMFIV